MRASLGLALALLSQAAGARSVTPQEFDFYFAASGSWGGTTVLRLSVAPDTIGQVVTSWPSSGGSTPAFASAVARDGSGNVFFNDSSPVIHRYRTDAGYLGSFPLPAPTLHLAANGRGALWTVSHAFTTFPFGAGQLALVPYGGGPPLASVPVTGMAIQLAADAEGGAWLGHAHLQLFLPMLTHVGASGAILASLPLATTLVDLAVAPDGALWTIAATVPKTLQRRRPTGSVELVVDLQSEPLRVDVDGCGVARVLAGPHLTAPGTGSRVYRVAADGQLLDGFELPTGFGAHDLRPDGAGNVWLEGELGDGSDVREMRIFDSHGEQLASIPLPAGAALQDHLAGDATALAAALIAEPAADFDGDGCSNDWEPRLARNPLDAASTPAELSVERDPAQANLLRIDYLDSHHPGAYYLLALSLGMNPGIALDPSGCPNVPLNPDALFALSLQAPAVGFAGFSGRLSAASAPVPGAATGYLTVPALAVPVGTRVFFGGVTLDASAHVLAIAKGTSIVIP